MDESITKLIVGLGNPGDDYNNTRHNIGFRIMDTLAIKQGLKFKKETKLRAEITAYTTELGSKVIVAKPLTFMNNSVDAVSKLMKFYKIPADNTLVVHDDVSMDTGKLRPAFNRGAGGQHGIEDIIEKLGGSKAFHRLKFGVGPDPGGEERADYVLSKFPKKESELINTTIEAALELIEKWLVN